MLVINGIHYLVCSKCGKSVSTGFLPVPTDTPDKGIIVRAWIGCPECIADNFEELNVLTKLV